MNFYGAPQFHGYQAGPQFHGCHGGAGKGFSLIVVLFILLVIVGTAYVK
ncbi:YjcZ family sporulation protein [Alkalihalobacterium chitinilyticum]|uniref:YjcZ family sporulation protein n=1 Tax=Alkalihalobacterium chitinilyticum TaxID=2980103 RepID=A0ABT5VBK2_9BACI|nr:YjcZ family sporulation protein [Alkalihalobacterium chitinilyticum]MDE5412852.1 YjcZ family sporulation protein [Alkalihalobacterium chitinilyticum]